MLKEYIEENLIFEKNSVNKKNIKKAIYIIKNSFDSIDLDLLLKLKKVSNLNSKSIPALFSLLTLDVKNNNEYDFSISEWDGILSSVPKLKRMDIEYKDIKDAISLYKKNPDSISKFEVDLLPNEDFSKKTNKDKSFSWNLDKMKFNEKKLRQEINNRLEKLNKDQQNYISKVIKKDVDEGWSSGKIEDLEKDFKNFLSKTKKNNSHHMIKKYKGKTVFLVMQPSDQGFVSQGFHDIEQKIYDSIDKSMSIDIVDYNNVLQEKEIKKVLIRNCKVRLWSHIEFYIKVVEAVIHSKRNSSLGIQFKIDMFKAILNNFHSQIKSDEKHYNTVGKSNNVNIKINLKFDKPDELEKFGWVVLYSSKKDKSSPAEKEDTLIHELGHLVSKDNDHNQLNLSTMQDSFLKYWVSYKYSAMVKNKKDSKVFTNYDIVNFIINEKINTIFSNISSFNDLTELGKKKILLFSRELIRYMINGNAIEKLKNSKYKINLKLDKVNSKFNSYFSNFEERVENLGDFVRSVNTNSKTNFIEKLNKKGYKKERRAEYILKLIGSKYGILNSSSPHKVLMIKFILKKYTKTNMYDVDDISWRLWNLINTSAGSKKASEISKLSYRELLDYHDNLESSIKSLIKILKTHDTFYDTKGK